MVLSRVRRSLWFIALSAVPASAQSIDQALQPLAERRQVIRLRAENAVITGRLQALAGGAATLETPHGTRTVPLASVDSAWARHRATGTGALIGGIAGGVAGAVFLGLLAAAACEYECNNIGLEGGLVGLALGGAGGALVGAAVGAAIPRWRLRFP